MGRVEWEEEEEDEQEELLLVVALLGKGVVEGVGVSATFSLVAEIKPNVFNIWPKINM